MKTLMSVALVLLSAGFAAAQSPSGQVVAPGLAVVGSKWRKDAGRSHALEDQLAREAQVQNERAREKLIRQNKDRAAAGQEQMIVPPPYRDPRARPERPSDAPAIEYVYEVTVSNTGSKKIRELDWQYVLLDPGTLREASRRQFTSKVTIRPGQRKKLVGRSGLAPLVNVTQSGKDLRAQYSERVEIDRIKYDDGSVWEKPSR